MKLERYTYTCPECATGYYEKEWNDSTLEEFSRFKATAIIPIGVSSDDLDFEYVCPGCYKQFERKYITKELVND